MSFSCFFVGDFGNEATKIAKAALSLGIELKNVEEESIASKAVLVPAGSIVFIAKPVSDNCYAILSNAIVITIGDESNYKNVGAQACIPNNFTQATIISLFDKFKRNSKSKSKRTELIFADPKMSSVVELCKRVALSNASVLITGESGTGKEVVTRFIHEHSSRSKNAFVAVNCAAIPDNLLESELFGHEKGAFTGAITQRCGRFEESHAGTLLLDEISEMSLHLQAKLLRAVQEKEITRLGGNKVIKVDCRIISSSNRDLKAYVAEEKFRADLYYRLNVINIELPPLRERKQDILALSEYFLEKYCTQNRTQHKKLSKQAIDSLLKYSWPGNVRELENAIQRSVILEGDEIDVIHGIRASGKQKSA